MALPVDEKNEDTIAAIATGMTEAGIGIIRISGKDSLAVADRLYIDVHGRKALLSYPSGTIHYGKIVDEKGEIIDEVLVSVMRHPHSYTTEDVVEINSHGGVYLLNRILGLVLASGARLSEPGEFTKRAFLGGRIDLSKAEAVMDLISSDNEFSRKNSIAQLEGAVSRVILDLREQLLHETAFIESAIDDPENYDLEGYPQKLDSKLQELIGRMDILLENAEDGRLMKEGIRTVILGKPNAGKSSLLNTLSHSDRAIVTEIAGTTRDTLEETVRCGDVLLRLTDTAGIRKTADAVEKIGVDRAIKAAENAELILFILDGSREIDDEDLRIRDLVVERMGEGARVIVLLNKSDLSHEIHDEDVRSLFEEVSVKEKIKFISLSLKEVTGLDVLKSSIEEMFHAGEIKTRDEIYLTNKRHTEAISKARDSLKLVRNSIAEGLSEDFYTIDLMNAYVTLGTILGLQADDDLVEEIFSKFCLGK